MVQSELSWRFQEVYFKIWIVLAENLVRASIIAIYKMIISTNHFIFS